MTATLTRSVEVVDSLALLSLKVAANVFDLSSGMNHVSIRDQIVRAQIAVRDLRRAGPRPSSLLIVGAGVAGVFAALAAADLGVPEVVVVDVAHTPFSLFRGITQRHVGPFMYEWPSPFYDDQSYPAHAQTPWGPGVSAPLSWVSATPCSADDLATLLTTALQARLADPTKVSPKIFLQADRSDILAFVKAFAAREKKAARDEQKNRPPGPRETFRQRQVLDYGAGNMCPLQITPQYVLLASGMGREDCQLVKVDAAGASYIGANVTGQSFWANDTLLAAATAAQRIQIFGGGDGAMQDALRALTGQPHPLLLLNTLKANAAIWAAIQDVMPALLSLDRQGRQYATWTHGAEAYGALDQECRQLAATVAARHSHAVTNALLRPGAGRVSLFVREAHFGKAYLLNRFLTHLIAACSPAPGRMGFQLEFSRQPVAYGYASGQHNVEVQDMQTQKVIQTHPSDLVVVRYGIERDSVPGTQMIQLSNKPSRQRTTLARVELPFVMR